MKHFSSRSTPRRASNRSNPRRKTNPLRTVHAFVPRRGENAAKSPRNTTKTLHAVAKGIVLPTPKCGRSTVKPHQPWAQHRARAINSTKVRSRVPRAQRCAFKNAQLEYDIMLYRPIPKPHLKPIVHTPGSNSNFTHYRGSQPHFYSYW